jgi:hypothetical protein
MAKRLTLLLAALMVFGFVLAGCGDDEGDTANDATTPAETATDTPAENEATTDDETEADSTGTVTEDGGGATAPTNLAEAVERCKQGANASTRLSDETKANLVKICEKAGSGDTDAIREATSEVCRQIVEDSVPEGTPGREQGLASCDQAGK